MIKRLQWVAVAMAAVMLSACGGGDDPAPAPPPPAPPPSPVPSPPPPAGSLPQVVGGRAELLAGNRLRCGHSNGAGEQALLGHGGAMTIHKGELWLADAGCGSAVQPGVRVIDLATGVVRTHVISEPEASGATRASGFTFPTGIAFDSKEQLFVLDGQHASSRFSTELLVPSLRSGFAGGIWKVTSEGMTVFAGVVPTGLGNGVGEAAGLGRPNSWVLDSQDNMYLSSLGVSRKVTPNGEVSTLRTGLAEHAVLVARDDQAWGAVDSASGRSLLNLVTGEGTATSPKWDWGAHDAKAAFYSVKLLTNTPSTQGTTTIYRRAAGSTEDVPVVTEVQDLQTAVFDAQNRLYLKQGGAIVRITFD